MCGVTGTVLGPGFGALGIFRGIGEGVDLLCGFTGTVRFAMKINSFAAHAWPGGPAGRSQSGGLERD